MKKKNWQNRIKYRAYACISDVACVKNHSVILYYSIFTRGVVHTFPRKSARLVSCASCVLTRTPSPSRRESAPYTFVRTQKILIPPSAPPSYKSVFVLAVRVDKKKKESRGFLSLSFDFSEGAFFCFFFVSHDKPDIDAEGSTSCDAPPKIMSDSASPPQPVTPPPSIYYGPWPKPPSCPGSPLCDPKGEREKGFPKMQMPQHKYDIRILYVIK